MNEQDMEALRAAVYGTTSRKTRLSGMTFLELNRLQEALARWGYSRGAWILVDRAPAIPSLTPSVQSWVEQFRMSRARGHRSQLARAGHHLNNLFRAYAQEMSVPQGQRWWVRYVVTFTTGGPGLGHSLRGPRRMYPQDSPDYGKRRAVKYNEPGGLFVFDPSLNLGQVVSEINAADRMNPEPILYVQSVPQPSEMRRVVVEIRQKAVDFMYLLQGVYERRDEGTALLYTERLQHSIPVQNTQFEYAKSVERLMRDGIIEKHTVVGNSSHFLLAPLRMRLAKDQVWAGSEEEVLFEAGMYELRGVTVEIDWQGMYESFGWQLPTIRYHNSPHPNYGIGICWGHTTADAEFNVGRLASTIATGTLYDTVVVLRDMLTETDEQNYESVYYVFERVGDLEEAA